MLIIYKIIINLAYAALRPYFAIKGWKSRVEWRQRLAVNPAEYLPDHPVTTPDSLKRGFCLHFHASSVGEIRVLERLIKAVLSIRPNLKFSVSTYTAAGQELARDLFKNAEAVFYFPLDCHNPLKRFFNHFHPDGIVMVETEIWPYFLDFCGRRNIPLILANGRLSQKSTRYYKIFKSALGSLFDIYKILIMQTEGDRRRMIEIGADPQRTIIMGNIKHDYNNDVNAGVKRAEIRTKLNLAEDEILLVAASTRPGEEESICRALKKVQDFPEKIRLLLAPRHLDRLDEVIKVLDAFDFSYTLYSDLGTLSDVEMPIVLMNKMGLLSDIFYGADLAFVGGTLADLGGHNIMEPVLAGVPVLFGPSVFNVRDASDHVIEKGLGLIVHDADELAGKIDRFLKGTLTFSKIETSGPSVAENTAQIIIRELDV